MPDNVKDARRRDWFHVDNALVDEHAAAITPIGVAIYCMLARLASPDGRCFPALPTICETLGLSRNAVRKYLDVLEERGLISREARFDPEGDATSYLFTIKHLSPSGKGGGSRGDLPGGSRGDRPPEILQAEGVGHVVTDPMHDVTDGGSPRDRRVGHVVTPKKTQSEQDSIKESKHAQGAPRGPAQAPAHEAPPSQALSPERVGALLFSYYQRLPRGDEVAEITDNLARWARDGRTLTEEELSRAIEEARAWSAGAGRGNPKSAGPLLSALADVAAPSQVDPNRPARLRSSSRRPPPAAPATPHQKAIAGLAEADRMLGREVNDDA